MQDKTKDTRIDQIVKENQHTVHRIINGRDLHSVLAKGYRVVGINCLVVRVTRECRRGV